MAATQRFEDLICRQHSRTSGKLACQFIYKENFFKDYPLKNQINSSSVSAMDNVSEGFEDGGHNGFILFVSVAKGAI